MSDKDEILNVYRHAKGLLRSAEKLARDEKVIKCYVCREFHLTTENHVVPAEKEKDGE